MYSFAGETHPNCNLSFLLSCFKCKWQVQKSRLTLRLICWWHQTQCCRVKTQHFQFIFTENPCGLSVKVTLRLSRVSRHHRELHDWMPNKGPTMLIRWDPPSQGNHHTIPLGFMKASVWSELTLNEDTQMWQTTGLTMSSKSCRHQPVRYMSKQELRRLGALRQDKVQKQQLVAFLEKKSQVFPFFISEISIKWYN